MLQWAYLWDRSKHARLLSQFGSVNCYIDEHCTFLRCEFVFGATFLLCNRIFPMPMSYVFTRADIQDMLDSDPTMQQLLMEAAGKEGLLWVFKQFNKLKMFKWDMCTEDNKTLLYFLLNGNVKSKEKRREVLTWLMETEQKGICNELARVVNKKDSVGVTVLSTACKMSGQMLMIKPAKPLDKIHKTFGQNPPKLWKKSSKLR